MNSGLVTKLVQSPPTAQLAADDWLEDQEFTPGEVVEIEEPIWDWFSEYLVVMYHAEDWFVADDGAGDLYFLWRQSERCFVRRLTDKQRAEFCAVAGVVLAVEPDTSADASPTAPPHRPPEPPASQQTLW